METRIPLWDPSLMNRKTPWWRNPLLWVAVVVVELILIAILAPDFSVQALHLFTPLL